MRCSLAVVVLALASSIAHADSIGGPGWQPPDCSGSTLVCPEGSSPASMGHSSCPSVCAPNAECQSASECASYGEGARCEPTRFCLVIRSSGPAMVRSVVDACEPTGPCGTPDPTQSDPPECSEVSRCIAPPTSDPPAEQATDSPPSSGGCAGCAVDRSASAAGIGVSLLVLVALALRRSR